MKRDKLILQVLMGLDIGGVETHVVELSTELIKRGYRVTVIANGGIYQSILRENKVEVINAPLHSRDLLSIIKSQKILADFIKENKVKVVHCHARMPAFILSILQKHLNFYMITTAHGQFRVNPLLRLASQWGDEVFAVSDDIRDYLIKNYDLKKDRISTTINGINLESFKSKDKFVDNKSIVHVSRLDRSTSLVASYLIKYASHNPEMEITIVGQGEEYKKLREQAEKATNVALVGKSANTAQFLEGAGIFVGISRAALEAMCYNVPVVLAGNYGYMGILEEEKLKLAMHNNFTARNTNIPSYTLLKSDLDYLIRAKGKEYTWEREFIKENYSVEKMVDDYESVYKYYL